MWDDAGMTNTDRAGTSTSLRWRWASPPYCYAHYTDADGNVQHCMYTWDDSGFHRHGDGRMPPEGVVLAPYGGTDPATLGPPEGHRL